MGRGQGRGWSGWKGERIHPIHQGVSLSASISGELLASSVIIYCNYVTFLPYLVLRCSVADSRETRPQGISSYDITAENTYVPSQKEDVIPAQLVLISLSKCAILIADLYPLKTQHTTRCARAPSQLQKQSSSLRLQQTTSSIPHPINDSLKSILTYSTKPHHEGLSYRCHRLHWVSLDFHFTLRRTRPQRVSSF